jgi:hypothetical protein
MQSSLSEQHNPTNPLRLIRPWMVVLLLAGLYCLATLAAKNWDPMSFVLIGRQYDPVRGTERLGYDGQFAYQIAVDPSGAPDKLDIPAYRYQRILYPMAVRLLGLGNPSLIPWMMILINIISVTLGTLRAVPAGAGSQLAGRCLGAAYSPALCPVAGFLTLLAGKLGSEFRWSVRQLVRDHPVPRLVGVSHSGDGHLHSVLHFCAAGGVDPGDGRYCYRRQETVAGQAGYRCVHSADKQPDLPLPADLERAQPAGIDPCSDRVNGGRAGLRRDGGIGKGPAV